MSCFREFLEGNWGFIVFQKVGVRKKKEAPGVVAGGPQRKILQRKRSIKEGERLFSLSLSLQRLLSISISLASRNTNGS